MKYLAGLRRLGTLIFLSLFLSAPLQAVPQYEVTDIGALLGAEFESEALVINNNGDVAGIFWPKNFTETEDTSHRNKETGFIYRRDGSIETLDRVDNQGIAILDMNDKGEFIGKWTAKDLLDNGTSLDESYFINRNGWIASTPLKSVSKINNNGDVLGEIDASRGSMTSSIGVLKPDGSVVDVLEGMDDCDRSIPDDCNDDNRLDFDSATFLILDMNDKGQVYFEAGDFESGGNVIVFTPGQGYKKIILPSKHRANKDSQINNNGVFTATASGRRGQRFSYIFASDGTPIETGGFIESSGTGAINDSNVVVVGTASLAFSFTNQSELLTLDMAIHDINNDNAAVGVNFISTPSSTESNAVMYTPVSGDEISIDGNFDDWEGVTRFIDSAEDGGTVNWYEVWADESSESLSFSYSHILNPINENERHLWNVYLDTDKQSTTGYNFELLGADYLVQGKNLYQYTGTGQDWAWSSLGDVDYAGAPLRVELSIAKSKLGMTGDASSYSALFYGANQDGSNVDYLLVDIEAGSGEVVEEEITIPSAG